MGKLGSFDIAIPMETFALRYFVETGTGTGESLAHACQFPFSMLWSCDIEPDLIAKVTQQFPDERVHLFVGTSVQMLGLLPQLPLEDRILFWLDAHFPGADSGSHSYDEIRDETIRLPLRGELALIKQHRSLNEDVIIIDDARIWLDDRFEAGPIPASMIGCRPSQLGIDFIYDLFNETHHIELLLQNEGYIILSPKALSGAALRASSTSG